jgi:hypothetical protein
MTPLFYHENGEIQPSNAGVQDVSRATAFARKAETVFESSRLLT